MAMQHLIARVQQPSNDDLVWGALLPATGLCGLCCGAGNLMCYQDGAREFWDCPACGGAGVRFLHGQPTAKVRAK